MCVNVPSVIACFCASVRTSSVVPSACFATTEGVTDSTVTLPFNPNTESGINPVSVIAAVSVVSVTEPVRSSVAATTREIVPPLASVRGAFEFDSSVTPGAGDTLTLDNVAPPSSFSAFASLASLVLTASSSACEPATISNVCGVVPWKVMPVI